MRFGLQIIVLLCRKNDAWSWMAQQMAKRGNLNTSHVDNWCERLHGISQVTTWRHSKQVLCGPSPPTADRLNEITNPLQYSTRSTIDCYPNPTGMTFCVSTNLVVDWSAFKGNVSNSSTHSHVSFAPLKGSSRAACHISDSARAKASPYLRQHATSHWFQQSIQSEEHKIVHDMCAPGSANMVEHPVLFLTRRLYNSYHNTEDSLNIFAMLAALNLPEVKEKGVQVSDGTWLSTNIETIAT